MSRRHLRPVPAAIQEEIDKLVGPAPRRDLLVEYLHRIQDAHGHIDTPRLAALAKTLKLSRAEVYESPPSITTSTSCAKARRRRLL